VPENPGIFLLWCHVKCEIRLILFIFFLFNWWKQ
jgi:hypothetical protein